MAVKNCKRKAAELAQALGTRLGPVVAIREDFCHQSNDITSSASEVSADHSFAVSVPNRLKQATLHVIAKTTVTFELRSHEHQSHKLH